MSNNYAPFTCTTSPNFSALLHQLRATIAISTYQAGKVIFISSRPDGQIMQLPRSFMRPMGIAVRPQQLAVAAESDVTIFTNSSDLAYHYPKQPQTYDALYMPRLTYHTNSLDIHDLEWGSDGNLYAVNTLFSCLIKLDANYNFTPVWQPYFIDAIASEDRCHLNGMAMLDGKPRYVTAFGKGNTYQSWRDNVTTSGILMDVENQQIITENLAMPHSPRVHQGKLYTLLSATGELIEINPQDGTHQTVCKLVGFVRGMAFASDFAFIGISKLRKSSNTFAKLENGDRADAAGVSVVHLPSGKLVAELKYLSSVEEIYDVQIIPNTIRPNILTTDKPEAKMGVAIPKQTFWGKPKEDAK